MNRQFPGIALLCCVAAAVSASTAEAQEPPGYRNGNQLDLIGGVEDPRYYGTGYFLDTEYGRYTYRHDHAHLDVSFGTLDTKAGLFDKLASKGTELRVSAVEPLLHGEIPFALHDEWIGDLQIGPVVSYTRTWYDTNTRTNIVQGSNTYRLDDLGTHLWGFGPDARFLFPPNDRCMRLFVGARFEGLGGWANPDPTLVANPDPNNGAVTAKRTAGVGDSEEVWGMRGEWSVGLMFADETTISGSFGLTKLRTKVINDLEENNDYTFWSINAGVPTDALLCRLRLLAAKLGL
jgi:hypothetical protein